MIWHLLLAPVTAFLTGLYNALPPWTVDLGGSWLVGGLAWLTPLDKYVPLHDGVLPCVTIAAGVFVALMAVKLFKFLLSLIPTISAGG